MINYKKCMIKTLPIIMLASFILLITTGCTSSSYPFISKNSSNSTIKKAETVEEYLISAGDVVTGKDWEFSIDTIDFTQRVDPPEKNMYYTYYQVSDSDNTYLYCVLNCKNISTIDLRADKVATVTVKYNNKYTYTSFSAVPDDTLGFTYTNITSIKPLTSEKVYFMVEMPKFIADETETPVDLIIKVENNVYKCKVR